ncbi:MAG: DHHA1 domain-containing protein [Pseudomonadota bacterium]
MRAAAVCREDGPNTFKVSLRSKGLFPILEIAENFGGGGHHFASGASVKASYDELREKILGAMRAKLTESNKANHG